MSHIDGRDPKSFKFENILFEKRGRRATVTINRPAVLNCVDLATLRELQLAFQDASWDDGISVVVLTGAGDRAFCTGADLKEQKSTLCRCAERLLEMDGRVLSHARVTARHR